MRGFKGKHRGDTAGRNYRALKAQIQTEMQRVNPGWVWAGIIVLAQGEATRAMTAQLVKHRYAK